MMPESNQGQGPNNQGSALGMNSLQLGPAGSPMMNRMEGGGELGAERTTEVLQVIRPQVPRCKRMQR